MIPAGVFNQGSEIPLNKQMWFSFWNPASAPNDSGIAVNHMGTTTFYSPEVFADGSSAAEVDLLIRKLSESTVNLGASAGAPLDFNQIGYTDRGNIWLSNESDGTFEVYIICNTLSGGSLTYRATPPVTGYYPLPNFYPVNTDLSFEDQFSVTLLAGQTLYFAGAGTTRFFGFIVVVP